MTYDLKELAECNFHIHTTYSECAKPDMQIEKIIEEAIKNGLNCIAITDHFHNADCPVLGQNSKMREKISGKTGNLRVLFGAELSVYGIGKYHDLNDANSKLDYRLYSYNHFHLDFWEQPLERTPRSYVEHSLAVLNDLFKTQRADCIAHPFMGRFIRCFDDKTLVTKAITDNELGDIMHMGCLNGCAWELNADSIISDPDFGKRYWNIGRENNVTFNMATDAHTLSRIDTAQFLNDLSRILQ